jgi:POT family proton-dependent oligopeptide transporter
MLNDMTRSQAVASPGAGLDVQDDTGFFGHPRGLATLFFTEMWERFSYYGMRAFLLVYMVTPVAMGGLGLADANAASIYGTYTGSAWGASILGGIVADRLLGQYRTVLVGGIIIALGHFTLAFQSITSFYIGLACIALGTGLLKPNVSTLVGSLYQPGDTRRDAGFSIFYMGINTGAVLGPFIAGYLAQRVNWHVGFASAGVGMTFGLIQYVLGRRRLQAAVDRLTREPKEKAAAPIAASAAPSSGGVLGFTGTEWMRIGAIVIFFLVASLFWGGYEQAGSTLALFAERHTRLEMFGFSFPSSWFQSVQGIWVVILAPIFAWMWMRLGSKDPSIPTKFAFGLVFMGLSFLLLMPAGALAQAEGGFRVSPWWLIWAFMISEFGELCVSPVGLSAVTKLAPLRILGVMMGVWFLSNALGNKIAGTAAGFVSSMPLQSLFGTMGGILVGAGVVMFLLVKPIKALMAGAK